MSFLVAKKKNSIFAKKTIFLAVFLLLGFSFSNAAFADLYTPGATLNPDCLPTDTNCDVIPYTADNTDIGLNTASSTFFLILDGNTLSTSTAGLKISDAFANSLLSTTSASLIYLPLSASTSLPYIPFASSTLYVPYTGATGGVNLNNQSLANVSTLSVGSTTAPVGGVAFFNGNVGIGTSTPTFALTLASSSAATGGIELGSPTADLYTYIQTGVPSIETDGSFGVGGSYLNMMNGGTILLNSGAIAGSGDIVFRTAGAPSSTINPVFRNKDAGGSLQDGLRFNTAWINSSSTDALGLIASSTISMVGQNIFTMTANKNAATGTFAIFPNILVGIGTTTPGATLSVQGTTGTDLLNIASSTGTSILYVKQNGFVGFNTNNPSWLGTFASPNNGTVAEFALTDQGNSQGFIISSISHTGYLTTNTANPILFRTNSTERMRLSATGGLSLGYTTDPGIGSMIISGNVGIGTTSPISLLSVMASNTPQTSPFISFNSTTSPIFNVLANGNVGIGTTTPIYALDVYGATSSVRIQQGNGSRTMTIDGNGMTFTTVGTYGTTAWGSLGELEVYNQTTNRIGLYIKGYGGQTADALRYASSTGGTLASITVAGGAYFSNNVGIGTTTPAVLLDVGNASSTIGAIATSSGVTDLVTLTGTYTGNTTQNLKIQITAASSTGDTFEWNVNGSTQNTGFIASTTAVALNYIGISVTFATTTGHTIGDYWTSTLTPSNGNINASNAYYLNEGLFASAFGTGNTSVGLGSMSANTTGYNNTAYGYKALYSNTTGSNNTANGNYALQANTTGIQNTANGLQALFSNTTGYYNTANGYQTLYSNTTGYDNTANGYNALQANTTGYNNTANGVIALYSNTTGYDNTANSMNALYSNTTGVQNTANGYSALYSNTTGSNNAAYGYKALFSNTANGANTANGVNALYSNTTGSYNTALGYAAGRYISGGSIANATSSNSLYLGYNTMALASGDTNEIVIGNNTVGLGSNTTVIGTTTTTLTAIYGNVGIGTTTALYPLTVSSSSIGQIQMIDTAATAGDYWYIGEAASNTFDVFDQAGVGMYMTNGGTSWTSASDERLKTNINTLGTTTLDEVLALNPVTYNWIATSSSQSEQVGFIAQQVAAAGLADVVVVPSNPNDCIAGSATATDCYGLDYDRFAPYLVKAIQVQQGFIATIETFINNLANGIAHLADIFVQQLTVGTPDAPTASGITMYDHTTGEAYCVFINNGAWTNSLGACGTQSSSGDTSGGGTASVGSAGGDSSTDINIPPDSSASSTDATSTDTTSMITTDASSSDATVSTDATDTTDTTTVTPPNTTDTSSSPADTSTDISSSTDSGN